jgi:hypothetical protein
MKKKNENSLQTAVRWGANAAIATIVISILLNVAFDIASAFSRAEDEESQAHKKDFHARFTKVFWPFVVGFVLWFIWLVLH